MRLGTYPDSQQYQHNSHHHDKLVVKTKPLSAQKADELENTHHDQCAAKQITQQDTKNVRPDHKNKSQQDHNDCIDKVIVLHILYD